MPFPPAEVKSRERNVNKQHSQVYTYQVPTKPKPVTTYSNNTPPKTC